jgi:hypothetical protein
MWLIWFYLLFIGLSQIFALVSLVIILPCAVAEQTHFVNCHNPSDAHLELLLGHGFGDGAESGSGSSGSVGTDRTGESRVGVEGSCSATGGCGADNGASDGADDGAGDRSNVSNGGLLPPYALEQCLGLEVVFEADVAGVPTKFRLFEEETLFYENIFQAGW